MRRVVPLGVLLVVACARARFEPVIDPQTRLDATIEGLGDTILRQHLELDSLAMRTDSLSLDVSRLEAVLRAREDTIRALRLELQRIKEIDLRRRVSRPKP